jgi:hypothetical protein
MSKYVNNYRITLELDDGSVFEWEGYADDSDHAEGLAIESAKSKKAGQQVNQVLEVEEFDQFEEISESEAEERYDDMLDSEGTVKVGGLEFYLSNILEKCDPIAYRCGFSDFTDYLLDDHILVEGFY